MTSSVITSSAMVQILNEHKHEVYKTTNDNMRQDTCAVVFSIVQ